MVKETGLKVAFIKKNKTNKPALSTICARQSRCEINTSGTGRWKNGGSQSPGMPPASTSPHLSPWPSWINRWFFRGLWCAPHGYYSMKILCGLPAVLSIALTSPWQLLLLQNECAAPRTISHFLLVALIINSITTQKLQVKRKLTYVFNVRLTLLNGRTVYAMLYYIQITLCFICFSSMHCVTGITTTFPNRHMKEEQMFSRDWNRIVQAMDAFEKKTNRWSIPGNSNMGLGHGLMQMAKDDVSFEWSCSSCLQEEGMGNPGR